MRFWLVFGWGNNTFAARAFESEPVAEGKAHTYNGVLVEIHVCEKDFQTYVVAHDYEYQKNNEPIPVNWIDEMSSFRPTEGWVPFTVPFVRVGKDISEKRYKEEHGEHG